MGGHLMRLGHFMMPLHPANRDYTQVLNEDLEAIVLADQLGYNDVWVGEHFTCSTEPVTSPLIFMAKAIPLTKQINFCTGVLNLPQQHPGAIAGFAAMFDHLCEGRFVMGVGPGGLPSDFEMFGVNDHMERGRMTLESIDIMLKIWTTDAPYDIKGEFWSISAGDWYVPEMGLGVLPKPYQKPHPKIALSGMSPDSYFMRQAGSKGWTAISANFIPASSVATHWKQYVEGAEEAGIEPDPANWHVARSILVTETDQEAEKYLARPDCAPRYYYDYLATLMKKGGFSHVMKGLSTITDDELTVDWSLENMVIAGSPKTVADKISALRSEIGPFGTLVSGAFDWDDKALWQNSMKLMAKEVLPLL